MTRRVRVAGLAVAAGLLLAGCSGQELARVHDGVRDITALANARDADGVREAVDDLLARLETAVRAGEMTSAEATEISQAALAVQAQADLIDQDLIERRQAEAEAEEARRQLEEERKRLEEERKRLAEEEAARKAAEEEAARKAAEEAARLEEERKQGEGEGEGEDGEGGGNGDEGNRGEGNGDEGNGGEDRGSGLLNWGSTPSPTPRA